MRMRSHLAAAGLLALLVLAVSAVAEDARAEGTTCPAMEGASPALAQIDAEARVRFLSGTLHQQARRARVWSWGWGITGTTLVAGNFTLAALATNREDRIDSIVGGSAALLIPTLLLLKPLRVRGDEQLLDEFLAQTWTPAGWAEKCLVLRRVEEMFLRDAENEAEGVGWLNHGLVFSFNLALALTLGFGLDHWKGALLNGGGGFLIGEAQILTQPTGAVTALEHYRAGTLEPQVSPSVRHAPGMFAQHWGLTPLLGRDRLGITLGASF